MLYSPLPHKLPVPMPADAFILQKAAEAMEAPPPVITSAVPSTSPGGPHDYYSNGDYWWPDPQKPDGLPYIQRDGQSNPDNFDAHRLLLRQMRDSVCYLTTAWKITGKAPYALRAAELLRLFFLGADTRMNPALDYAQAIPGVCDGRGIGIIDTLHLTDIPMAIEALRPSGALSGADLAGLKQWFSAYLRWLLSSKNGREEMAASNNHSICFFVQAAAFALFTDDKETADRCRTAFRRQLAPQMALDGSFPRELSRTKPYSYSLFALDNLIVLCQLLSRPGEDLWTWQDSEGRGILPALRYMAPYLLDKSRWPLPPDVEHFDSFPIRYAFLTFAGCRLGLPELTALNDSLPPEPADEEARRNRGVIAPWLWYHEGKRC